MRPDDTQPLTCDDRTRPGEPGRLRACARGLKIPWASARAGSTPAPGTHTTWPSLASAPVPKRLNERAEMSTDGADPVVSSSATTLPTIGPCWNP
jgi:hypothetical protein